MVRSFANAVVLTPEEIEKFKTDDEYFWRFRHTMEHLMNVRSIGIYQIRGCPLVKGFAGSVDELLYVSRKQVVTRTAGHVSQEDADGACAKAMDCGQMFA